jgi:aquaporin Z
MRINLIIRQFLAEFYGTFMLVFIGTGAISVGLGTNPLIIGLSFGFALIAAIYTLGHISGGHFNPVISLAKYLDQSITSKQLIVYLFAQFLGALFGSLSLLIFSDSALFFGFGTTTFTQITLIQAILVEIFLTFIFVYTVLAISNKKSLSSIHGVVIGLTLAVLITIGVPLTGGSLNPARSLSAALLTGGESLNQLIVYIISPMIGSVLASIFYRYLKFKE